MSVLPDSNLTPLHLAVRAHGAVIAAALHAYVASGTALEDLVLVVIGATHGATQVRVVRRRKLAASMATRGTSLARLCAALTREPPRDVVRVMSIAQGRTVVGDLGVAELGMLTGGQA